jgi:hypothetical protein
MIDLRCDEVTLHGITQEEASPKMLSVLLPTVLNVFAASSNLEAVLD